MGTLALPSNLRKLADKVAVEQGALVGQAGHVEGLAMDCEELDVGEELEQNRSLAHGLSVDQINLFSNHTSG